MIYKLVVFCYLLAVALGYSDLEYRSTFTQWMQDQSKSYKSEEFHHRFSAFKANMDYVAEWNAKNSETKLGMTMHADLTNAEYRKFYLGTHIDATAKLAAARDVVAATRLVGDTYNSSVDWRTHNPPIVTGIKNQGQCGSCWSFSTTGSVEGAHALSTGKLVSLSEQNLVDCSTAQGNQGCDGGLMDQAFQYIISNKGIDTEDSYPYTATGPNACKFKAANVGATISSYTDVTSGSEADLQTAASQQPVSVAIDASHASFQLYSSGVYHELFCSQTKLDHGVLVVGWGTDTTSNKQYWIVKNSWGASWGQQGYIYMSRNRNNNCGIATSASWPTV